MMDSAMPSHTRVYNGENSLGDDGVQGLSQTWGTDESLTMLNLAANKIGVTGAAALGRALRASFSITSVDCSRNIALGDEGTKLLVPALRTDGMGTSTLRDLNLIRCGVGDIGAIALATSLLGNSVLERLKLSGNRIGDAGAIALVNSLVGLSRGFLAELWLSSNRIGPAGAEGVAAALSNSPSVRELHLSGNALEDVGVAALVKGAVAGQRLRGLYLGGCGLRDPGAKEVADALQSSLHLETLCLGHGFIGDNGASALARSLAENRALRRLLLPGNLLRAAGGKAIAGMLISNRALFHLDVSNNCLGSTGIEAVASAFAKNTTLLELNVSGCGGTDASFRAMARAVETNETLGSLLCAGNHLGADTLAEIDYAMRRAKRPVRELVGQVQTAIDVCDHIEKGREQIQSTDDRSTSQGAGPSVQLAPGQQTAIQVAFGRRDNIVGSILVANETCLEDARVLIDPLLQCSERDAFNFMSTTGGVIPPEDERARRVVWDCELPVRLRPASWVAIGEA